MALMLVPALALPVAAPAAPAPDVPLAVTSARPKCLGKVATIVGTKRSERGRRKIVGTRKADVIVAKGGADDVRGRGGNDVICAGPGNDKVDGGSGRDSIDGGSGNDRLKGSSGDDALAGGSGNDRLDGGRGTDICVGGKGRNRLVRCEPLPLSDPSGPPGLTRAAPDAATTTEDASVTIPVLANDTGNGLTIASVQAGTAQGALTISGGSIVYDPRGKLDALAAGQSATETFTYTVAAGAGATATGTVTVTVTGIDDAPVAVADMAEVRDGTPAAIDVLANDTDPDGGPRRIASVDTFGSSGSVAVAADASGLTYTPGIGVCNVTDSFTYTLEGGSSAKVTVSVVCDGTVDDAATLAEDAGATAIDVLANDATPASGTKTISGVTQGAHGAVVITGGGTGLTYSPALNYCGEDSFTYTLAGGSVATVSVTVTCVNDAPSADDESFTGASGAVGNTPLAIGTTRAEPRKVVDGDVLTGDTDIESATLSTVAETIATAQGGSAVMEPDGEFVYHPPAGFVGTDTFTYTVTDGTATDSGTVTIEVAGLVWYVDAAAAAGGNGTGAAPLNALAQLNNAGSDLDAAGHQVFLHSGTYTGGLALEASQVLRSESVGLAVGGHTLVTASGANAEIQNAAGNALTLSTDNAITGVNLGAATGASSLAGSSFGTATVGSVSVNNPSGAAINLTIGTLNGTFTAVGSANSPAQGVRLENVNGTIAASGGAISNATGAAVRIGGGAANFTYAGTITDGSGALVDIASTTGGTRIFSGAVTDAVDNDNGAAGVSIANSAGTTRFSGGLALSTGANHAFVADTAGTIGVSGSANTLKTTAGSALRVVSTAIEDGDLNFRRIDSNGGSSGAGIHLENTGGNGGLTVTGNGTAGSGGTIANKSGADGTTAGIGVFLSGTREVSLARMQLNDFQNYAIKGSTVNNFTLADSVVSGTSGTNAGIDEAAVAFTQLTGAAAVTTSNISGSIEDNLQVRNSSGTLNRLVVDGTTIGANSFSEGNDGIGLVAGGGTFNVTISNSFLTAARGDLLQHDTGGNSAPGAQSDLVVSNTAFSNSHGNILPGGGGVVITAGGTGDLTYNIASSTFKQAKGVALLVNKLFGGAPGDGTARGTITGNVIGVAGQANSGSMEGSGISLGLLARGLHTARVEGNQIRRYSNHGILLTAGNAATSVTGVTHDGTANWTIRNNVIAEPNAPAGGIAQNGIHLNSGTNSPDNYNVCLNLGSPTPNTVMGSGALGGTDYRLRQRFETDVRLPGYTGPQHDDGTALTTYLTPRTSGSFTLSATNQGVAGGGFFNTAGGAACPLP